MDRLAGRSIVPWALALVVVLTSLSAAVAAPMLSTVVAQSLCQANKAEENYVTGRVTNSLTGNGIEWVTVVADADTTSKALAVAYTDGNGDYLIEWGATTATTFRLNFSELEYVPQIIGNISSGELLNVELDPLNVARPFQPIAVSAPQTIYVYWCPNAEFNLKGYYVWRAEVDPDDFVMGDDSSDPPPSVTALTDWEQISGLLFDTEFIDTTAEKGTYYSYRIQALSGGDRLSELSLPSVPPVKPDYLMIFFPEYIYSENPFANTYIWDLDETGEWWIRLPVCSRCAYDVNATGMGIEATLPLDLLKIPQLPQGASQEELDAVIRVETTSITSGMRLAYFIPEEGTVKIASADVVARSLAGEGTLFDIYLKSTNADGCPEEPNLHLVEEYPDPPFGGGVVMYDDQEFPESIPLELQDGTLCTVGGCIHGDVEEDNDVDIDDVDAILELWVGQMGYGDLGCFPWSADMNMDLLVTQQDATLLMNWVENGIINPPPTEAKGEALKAISFKAYEKTDEAPVFKVGAVPRDQGSQVVLPVTVTSSAILAAAGFTLEIGYPLGPQGVAFVSAERGADLPADFRFASQNSTIGAKGIVKLAAVNTSTLGGKGDDIEIAKLRFNIGPDAPLERPLRVVINAVTVNDMTGFSPDFFTAAKPEIWNVQKVIGDADGDGRLTAFDMTLLDLRDLEGREGLNEKLLKASRNPVGSKWLCDVDKSGLITAWDRTLVDLADLLGLDELNAKLVAAGRDPVEIGMTVEDSSL